MGVRPESPSRSLVSLEAWNVMTETHHRLTSDPRLSNCLKSRSTHSPGAGGVRPHVEPGWVPALPGPERGLSPWDQESQVNQPSDLSGPESQLKALKSAKPGKGGVIL